MKLKAMLLLAALVGAPAQAQGLPPASADEIMAGARSCLAATSPAGVDQAKLQADGWRRGTMSAEGKPVDGRLLTFSKNGLSMMLNGTSAGSNCMFTAQIATVRDFPKLQAAMAATYGKPVRDDGKGEQMFFTADNHLIDLASTGSRERPAVRVAVGPVSQEKK